MKKAFAVAARTPHFPSGLLHWILPAVLLVTTSTFVPTNPHSESTPGHLSVLELQQLVDAMLLADRNRGTNKPTNVLELQRALLSTIAPDESPDDSPTAPRDAGVLPVPARFLLPAVHSLRSALDAISSDQAPTVTPPPTGHLPPTAGTRMRYQFHLLSNAPPAAGSLSTSHLDTTTT